MIRLRDSQTRRRILIWFSPHLVNCERASQRLEKLSELQPLALVLNRGNLIRLTSVTIRLPYW